MISIVKAIPEDSIQLSELAVQTFLESHGHSAKQEDINAFVSKNYSSDALEKELADSKNIFHILYYNNKAAGFSKIILNYPYEKSTIKNVTKLERIYVLKEFYDLKLGSELLGYNLQLIKDNRQAGVWLFVWIENERAFNFYKKKGFEVIGNFDFRISETHTNPNYQMLLMF